MSRRIRGWFWQQRHTTWLVREEIAKTGRLHARRKLRNLGIEVR